MENAICERPDICLAIIKRDFWGIAAALNKRSIFRMRTFQLKSGFVILVSGVRPSCLVTVARAGWRYQLSAQERLPPASIDSQDLTVG